MAGWALFACYYRYQRKGIKFNYYYLKLYYLFRLVAGRSHRSESSPGRYTKKRNRRDERELGAILLGVHEADVRIRRVHRVIRSL